MTDIKKTPIPQRLKNVSADHPYVAGAADIFDDDLDAKQSDINHDQDVSNQGFRRDIDKNADDIAALNVEVQSEQMVIGATVFDAWPTLNSSHPVTSDGIYRKDVQAEVVVGDPTGDWNPTTAEAAYERCQRQIELLNGSEVIPVADHTAVSSPDANKIYREQGTDSYTDWMYYDNAWYDMATYDFPGIDEEPTKGSDHLVESGSTFTIGGSADAMLGLGENSLLTDIRSRFTTWTDGYVYVGATTGSKTKGNVYTDSTLFVYSNFVDVSDLVGKWVILTVPVSTNDHVGVAIYDTSQNLISAYKKNIEGYNVFAIKAIEIPSDAKYLRTSFYKASLLNFSCKYSDTNGVVGETDILKKYRDNCHDSYITNARCYKINPTMTKGNISAEDGTVVSTDSNYFIVEVPVQSGDNTIYVKGANKYASNYGMAGYIDGTFYAGHKLYGDEVIDISDWVNHGVDSIKISSSSNCTVAIGNDYIFNTISNKRNVSVVPVNKTSGNRNVSSEDGSFSESTYATHYANEIRLDDVTLIEIDHLLSYSGNYGYAYLDDNDNLIYGKRLHGQRTITTNKLLYYRNLGATKLRISVSNRSTIKVTKLTSGNAIDDIYTKIGNIEETNSINFYNYIGEKGLYLPETLPNANNFASLTAIYDAYDALHTQHPEFMSEATVIGVDESETYDIKAYSLGFQYPLVTNDRAGENTNLFDNYNINKRHVLVTSGVHPTEKNSIEGTYLAIKEILESTDDWAMFIKNNFIIDIVPVINPWGVVNNVSTNVNDVNLNRDYDNQTQNETKVMCAFIDSLKENNLVGIIDLHNTTSGNGYLVTKDWYKYFDYYVVLTQQISSEMYDVLKVVYGTTKQNNFHTWLASDTGQLHEYADSINVLGVTVEFNANTKSPTLTKTACINIINQFATFDGFVNVTNSD